MRGTAVKRLILSIAEREYHNLDDYEKKSLRGNFFPPEDPPPAHCPLCGEEVAVETELTMNRWGEVVGCESCLRRGAAGELALWLFDGAE